MIYVFSHHFRVIFSDLLFLIQNLQRNPNPLCLRAENGPFLLNQPKISQNQQRFNISRTTDRTVLVVCSFKAECTVSYKVMFINSCRKKPAVS